MKKSLNEDEHSMNKKVIIYDEALDRKSCVIIYSIGNQIISIRGEKSNKVLRSTLNKDYSPRDINLY